MTALAPNPAPRSRAVLAAMLVVALPVPFLAYGRVQAAPEVGRQIDLAMQGSHAALLHGTGIPDDELAALQRTFVGDGRVVVFYDLVAMPPEAQAQLLPMLESRTQLYRNLLYPRPRDSRMAASVEQLRERAAASSPGPLLVVDLRQDGAPLPPVGDFELVHERESGVRVRHWLRRGGGK